MYYSLPPLRTLYSSISVPVYQLTLSYDPVPLNTILSLCSCPCYQVRDSVVFVLAGSFVVLCRCCSVACLLFWGDVGLGAGLLGARVGVPRSGKSRVGVRLLPLASAVADSSLLGLVPFMSSRLWSHACGAGTVYSCSFCYCCSHVSSVRLLSVLFSVAADGDAELK